MWSRVEHTRWLPAWGIGGTNVHIFNTHTCTKTHPHTHTFHFFFPVISSNNWYSLPASSCNYSDDNVLTLGACIVIHTILGTVIHTILHTPGKSDTHYTTHTWEQWYTLYYTPGDSDTHYTTHTWEQLYTLYYTHLRTVVHTILHTPGDSDTHYTTHTWGQSQTAMTVGFFSLGRGPVLNSYGKIFWACCLVDSIFKAHSSTLVLQVYHYK